MSMLIIIGSYFNKKEIKNYRPVAILSALPKLF